MDAAGRERAPFTRYEVFVIALLAFLQFTVVVDFIILSPLGAILLGELHITPAQFGRVVSAYAFSAGASGILAAGFADRFDRRRFLLFFYVGFVVGTLLCGIAPNYEFLLAARIFTGVFGGVIGAISLAIVADLFPLSRRGRVLGTVQASFSAAQILGLPIGLSLANAWGWHAPFLMIVAVATLAGAAIVFGLRPITSHMAAARTSGQSAIGHLLRTATRPRYVAGFLAAVVIASGGFMLMPFGSPFVVQNLGLPVTSLPTFYMLIGIFSLIGGVVSGKVSDKFGKYRTFAVGTLVMIAATLWFTRLTQASFALLVAINAINFAGMAARMVSSFALSSALPEMADRGAFMSISSSLQQFSGGAAAWMAGLIVSQANPAAPLENYDAVGVVVAASCLLALALMYIVRRLVAVHAN